MRRDGRHHRRVEAISGTPRVWGTAEECENSKESRSTGSSSKTYVYSVNGF